MTDSILHEIQRHVPDCTYQVNVGIKNLRDHIELDKVRAMIKKSQHGLS